MLANEQKTPVGHIAYYMMINNGLSFIFAIFLVVVHVKGKKHSICVFLHGDIFSNNKYYSLDKYATLYSDKQYLLSINSYHKLETISNKVR